MDKQELLYWYERQGYVKSDKVKKAFLKVDRKFFVPKGYEDIAYDDRPLPIPGGGTISAPHMHVIYLEELELKPGLKVLEIGAGSGILLAYIKEIVKNGKVYGVELSEAAYRFAINNLKKSGYYKKVKLIKGNGFYGLPRYTPYDRIACSATVRRLPDSWVKQLKNNGIILVPIEENGIQYLYKIRKIGKKIKKEKLMEVLFVPLVF